MAVSYTHLPPKQLLLFFYLLVWRIKADLAKLWTSKNGIGIFSNITFLFSEQYVRMILLNKYYSVHSP